MAGSAPAGSTRSRISAIATVGLATGLWWSTAGVLLTHPVTRLQEFAGATRVVDALAGRIEDNAIVIAEGIQYRIDHGARRRQAALDTVRELALPLGAS